MQMVTAFTWPALSVEFFDNSKPMSPSFLICTPLARFNSWCFIDLQPFQTFKRVICFRVKRSNSQFAKIKYHKIDNHNLSSFFYLATNVTVPKGLQ